MTPDAKTCVFGYHRMLADLYLVEGLKVSFVMAGRGRPLSTNRLPRRLAWRSETLLHYF